MRPAPFLRRRRGKQTDGGGTGSRCVLRLKWIDPSRREESRGEGSLIGSWQADGETVQGAHRCSFTSGGVASINVENWSWNSGEMFSKTIRCQCIDITFSCTLNQLFFFFFQKPIKYHSFIMFCSTTHDCNVLLQQQVHVWLPELALKFLFIHFTYTLYTFTPRQLIGVKIHGWMDSWLFIQLHKTQNAEKSCHVHSLCVLLSCMLCMCCACETPPHLPGCPQNRTAYVPTHTLPAEANPVVPAPSVVCLALWYVRHRMNNSANIPPIPRGPSSNLQYCVFSSPFDSVPQTKPWPRYILVCLVELQCSPEANEDEQGDRLFEHTCRGQLGLLFYVWPL